MHAFEQIGHLQGDAVEGRAGEQPGDRFRFGIATDGVRLFEREGGAAVRQAEPAR